MAPLNIAGQLHPADTDFVLDDPNATKIQNGDSPYGGARELVRVPKMEISAHEFSAKFYFLNRKLVQVTLSLAEQHSFESAHLVFTELVDLLRTEYGRELSFREAKGFMSRSVVEWISGYTNIDLLLLGVGNHPAILNVNYQNRVAGEAKKL